MLQKAVDDVTVDRSEFDTGEFKPDQEVTGVVLVLPDLPLGDPASSVKIVSEGKDDGGEAGQKGARQGPGLGYCRQCSFSICLSERTTMPKITVRCNAELECGNSLCSIGLPHETRHYTVVGISALNALSAFSLQETPKGATVFVSTAGATTAIPTWIEAWKPNRILCAYDADTTGDQNAKALQKHDPRVERFRPKGAKDWNEIIQRKTGAQ